LLSTRSVGAKSIPVHETLAIDRDGISAASMGDAENFGNIVAHSRPDTLFGEGIFVRGYPTRRF
jgi:hypothetical protein